MKPRLHPFDGEELTLQQIMQRVPAYGRTAIRRHLAAGRNTTETMLAFDHQAARHRAGVAGRAVSEANSGFSHHLAHWHSRAKAKASGFIARNDRDDRTN